MCTNFLKLFVGFESLRDCERGAGRKASVAEDSCQSICRHASQYEDCSNKSSWWDR